MRQPSRAESAVLPRPLRRWRLILERMRSDWPIVGAAWLITLLGAAVLAAGPLYANAVSLAGLHRVLADAAVPDANVEVTLRSPLADVEAANATVTRLLRDATGDLPVTIAWSGRSNVFDVPGPASDGLTSLAVLGFVEGIEDHAVLLDGAWPVDTGRGLDVALSESAVADLAVAGIPTQVGDRLELSSRLDSSMRVTARITGIYRAIDPVEPFWWEDQDLLARTSFSSDFRVIGPLVTTRAMALQHAGSGSATLIWHAFPHFEQLGVDQTAAVRDGIDGLAPRLEAELPDTSAQARTRLFSLLSRAERSLLVSRTGILIIVGQLVLLAAYAIVMTAGLLVDHRTVQLGLLRSRGATSPQLAGLALAEGLLLAAPAILVGPWLAAIALGLLNVAGPLAEIALGIQPVATVDAFVAAAIGAGGCVVLLVLPNITAGRTDVAERLTVSRPGTRAITQRFGIDIGLLAVTIIALWQLRLHGGPLTESVRGTVGLDPLLVAAPAIGILAGGVLALRVLPHLATAAERLVARSRHIVGPLSARQLARRPLRYARPSLLLILAMSTGIFAVSYGSTWADSQLDQAAYQVGADVRVVPAHGPSALASWAVGDALRSTPGVVRSLPIDRERVIVSDAADAGELIGINPAGADLVHLRSDQARGSLASVLEPLAAARDELPLIQLDAGPARMLVGASVDIGRLLQEVSDPQTGQASLREVSLSVLEGRPVLGAAVNLLDADGLVHRYVAAPVALNPDGQDLVEVILQPAENAAEAGLEMAAPVSVAGVELHVALPGLVYATAGTVALTSLAWTEEPSESPDGWRALELEAAGGWRTTLSLAGQLFSTPVPTVDGLAIGLSDEVRLLGSGFTIGNPNVVGYQAIALARLEDAPMPVVVNQVLLDRAGTSLGEVIEIPLFGATRMLHIAGVIGSFPTADPDEPILLADFVTLQIARFSLAGRTAAADEWWLEVEEATQVQVSAGVRGAPLAADEAVTSDEQTTRLSTDPVALGIIGVLSVGFVASGLVAVIGLAISAAVAARERRTEFAILRALGVSGKELSRWLWAENAAVVSTSLVGGTALGLTLGWVVLPYITVTQQGGRPFPPALLEVPWGAIGVLELVSVCAVAATVTALARILRGFGIGSALRMGED